MNKFIQWNAKTYLVGEGGMALETFLQTSPEDLI